MILSNDSVTTKELAINVQSQNHRTFQPNYIKHFFAV